MRAPKMDALKRLRQQIDKADEQILKGLGKRCRIVQKVAQEKARQNLPIIQTARRAQIQKDRSRKGEALGLSPVFVEKLFKLIQTESVHCQKKIISDLKTKKKSRSKKGNS